MAINVPPGCFNLITPECVKLIKKMDKLDPFDHLDTEFHYREGIYFLIDCFDIVYIGRSVDVYERIKTHQREALKVFSDYAFIPVRNEYLDQVERFFINKYLPIYNVDFITLKMKKFRHGEGF